MPRVNRGFYTDQHLLPTGYVARRTFWDSDAAAEGQVGGKVDGLYMANLCVV